MHTCKKNILFYVDKTGIAIGFLKSKTIYFIDFDPHDIWLTPHKESNYHDSGATVSGWLIFHKAVFVKKPKAEIIQFPIRRCSNG